MQSWEHKRTVLDEMVARFVGLWNERVNAAPKFDLISMLAHGESTKNMDRLEYAGNLGLLNIGGNDTTRNTISGSVYALNKNQGEYAKPVSGTRGPPSRLVPATRGGSRSITSSSAAAPAR